MKITKFKDIWSDRKYRSLIQLGIYAFLILFLFCIVDFTGTHNTSYNKKEIRKIGENLFGFDNFEYIYIFTFVSEVDEPYKQFTVEGKTYMQDSLFSIKEMQDIYYMRENVLYQVKDTLIKVQNNFFDFSKLNPSNLQKYIEEMTLEYKTDYNNQTTKSAYTLPISQFSKIYMNEDNQKEGSVFLNAYTKEKQIYKIELDMRAYNGVFIEIEKVGLGKNAEENVLREKRKNFYEKIGFKKLNVDFLLFDVIYTPYIFLKSKEPENIIVDNIFNVYEGVVGKERIKQNCKILKEGIID